MLALNHTNIKINHTNLLARTIVGLISGLSEEDDVVEIVLLITNE